MFAFSLAIVKKQPIANYELSFLLNTNLQQREKRVKKFPDEYVIPEAATYTWPIKLWKLIAAAAGKSLPSCPTLYDPIDSSPPGSSVPGILQARYWSGLPFPPPMQACMLSHFSCARLCAVKFKTQKIYSELERIPNIPSTISSLLHTKLPQQ